MFSNNCDFCDEFSAGNDNAFAKIYAQQLKSRIVLRSENFAVMPSLGQIVEGHTLIVPVRHYTALADMPAQIVDEVSELCLRVRSTLAESYGPTVFFEHGVRGTQAGGCGVDHAHLHAVPFACAIEPIEQLKRSHPLKSVVGISDVNKQVSPDLPYLYYEQTDGRAWTCEVDFIPSQYLRKMVAESLGVGAWDWRECGREPALLSSISRLSALFLGDSVRTPALKESATQTASAAAGIVR